MIAQSLPLYALVTGKDHAALHLVIGWVYTPPMPMAVTLASTNRASTTGAQPLSSTGITYYDDRTEARTAYEAARLRGAA